jgi:hypothetical protein
MRRSKKAKLNFTSHRFQSLADDLRGWASIIINAADSQDSDELSSLSKVTTHLEWLDDCSVMLQPSTTASARKIAGLKHGGQAYRAEVLLNCWRLSLVLKSSSDVRRAIDRAACLALPADLATDVLKNQD